MPDTIKMTLSEGIRKCREFSSCVKIEKDVIIHGTSAKENLNIFGTVEDDAASQNVPPEINLMKIRDCRVVLKDISNEIKNGKLADMQIIKFNSKKAINLDSISISTVNGTKTSSINRLKCEYCDSMLLKESISKHMKKYHIEKMNCLFLDCQFCDLKQVTVKGLDRHMTKSHPDKERPHFECDFDGKIFKTKKLMLEHIKSHKLRVKCEICQAEIGPVFLKGHIRLSHPDQDPQMCNICKKYFKSIYSLKHHLQQHNKNLKCEICFKMFQYQGNLNTHMKFHHINPKSFACDICGKKFNQKTSLKRHQKMHDLNRSRPFKCQRCDYATDNKHYIPRHLKCHERLDEKFAGMKNPLKCDKCLKFCRNRTALLKHQHIAHPAEMFQCDLCGKYIKAFQSIKRHIYNHIDKNIQNFEVRKINPGTSFKT